MSTRFASWAGIPVLALMLVLAACSGSSDPAPTNTTDGGLADPTHDKCTQPGMMGNSLHVGQYCTAGGTECDSNAEHGWAYLCTLSQRADAPLSMCTMMCFVNSDCGEDAVCTNGDESDKCSRLKGCVPKACTDDKGLESASECEKTDGGMTADGGM